MPNSLIYCRQHFIILNQFSSQTQTCKQNHDWWDTVFENLINNRGEQVGFSINYILVSRAENFRTPNYKAAGRMSGYKHKDSVGSKYNICLIWMAHIKLSKYFYIKAKQIQNSISSPFPLGFICEKFHQYCCSSQIVKWVEK